MPRVESEYIIHQAKKGLVDRYEDFNKLTRNIGLGVAGVAVAIGAWGIVPIAALSVVVDQAQISIIERYKKWRNKSNTRMSLQPA